MRNAIAADDSYAPAYSGLANSAAALNRMSLMAPDEANAIIRPAIARALELDPSLAEAHCMLGGYRLYSEWDWPGAEQSLRQAITLNPSSSVAYGGLAELYEALDRNDDAVRCWTEACHFDPLSVFFPTLLGGTLVLAGRPAQAAEQLRATLRQEPHFWLGHEILGFALADLGRYAEAIEAEQTAVQLSPDVIPKTALGYIYARAGLTEETRRLLQELQELSGRRYVSPLVPAALLTALGDCDQALDHLERGCVVRDPVMVLLRSFPFWRSLHDHPRYQQIVRSMNFPD
jgi:tetratricopeptide (TPR) repeat protein